MAIYSFKEDSKIKSCIEIFEQEMKERFPDHLKFMDSFGWYCKKYYFHEKSSDDPEREKIDENSEFYDLMDIVKENQEFLLFISFLSERLKKEQDGNT